MIKRQTQYNIWRAIVVFIMVGTLTMGITMAALQSQTASLTGNTIESATADLRIGTTNSSFSNTRIGFDFPGVVPGGVPAPAGGNTFYLKNFGTTNLAVKVAIGTAPSNLNNVNLAKVYLNFTRVDTGYSVSISLKSMVDGYAAGGISLGDTINGGVIAQYSVKASMDLDAFNGTSASISGIDLIFTGTGV